jgi:hypothetical protein
MRRAERPASLVLVTFGLGVMYYAHQHLKLGMMITPGAGFLPFWVGTALAILGVVWFVQTMLAGRAAEEMGSPADAAGPQDRGALSRLLPGVALVIAYAWLFERAGFLVATFVFMVSWQKLVERERWGRTLLIAAVTAGTMYALFSLLLKGVLPSGAWFG